MFNKFIDSVRDIFASSEKKLEMKTRQLAVQTTNDFDNLQKIIKDSEYAIADQQKASDDRTQFLKDNTNTLVDQNVSRNEDTKRAYMLLTGVMLIGCILSVKGLKFFFGEFYASISLLMIIPIAMTLAGVIVIGSIYLNNFSNRFQGQNPFVYYQLKATAYAMVLFIPTMNLLEGFDSNYRPVVMALNIVGCVIDFVLHTSLVSMSSVFITAEDSKKAIKIMKLKDQALTFADQKLRAFNDTFIKAKTTFTNSAKLFVSSFKELESIDPTAAANTLFLLDNFTVFMIRNKVYQHAIIKYHADENGNPVLEYEYFSPEQDNIRRGWDNLSRVNIDYTNSQPENALNGKIQAPELLAANEISQRVQNHVEDSYQPSQVVEQTDNNPADYDTILDNVNPNDKTL